MVVVVVALVFRHHFVPLGTHGGHVKLVHGRKIGGVKAGTEHGALDRFLRSFFGTVNG